MDNEDYYYCPQCGNKEIEIGSMFIEDQYTTIYECNCLKCGCDYSLLFDVIFRKVIINNLGDK